DRRSPARWILSHAMRNKLLLLGVCLGAFGNAMGAGLVATYTGQAFEAVTRDHDLIALWGIIVWLVVSQVIRGGLMLVRNFCSEAVGQRVERDARDELYSDLIGKSMSFHDRQATGDLMARATNDVREI